MIFTLDESLQFPDPALAEPDGFLAIGGDLRPERLLLAYRNGIFPWFAEGDPICWFSPHERCVIFPAEFALSKSMKKILLHQTFRITVDECFEDVNEQCRQIPRRDQDGTWITAEMMEAYSSLHRMGVAHSIEAWEGRSLVGGIYGLGMNRVFCGESMFSKKSNASKAALAWLCASGSYDLIDCQVPNPHLLSLGARMISRKEYMTYLNR